MCWTPLSLHGSAGDSSLGQEESFSGKLALSPETCFFFQFITCEVFPPHWDNSEITFLVASCGAYLFYYCRNESLILLRGLQTFTTQEGGNSFSFGVPLFCALGIFTERSWTYPFQWQVLQYVQHASPGFKDSIFCNVTVCWKGKLTRSLLIPLRTWR